MSRSSTVLFYCTVLMVVLLALVLSALARDNGQWADTNQQISQWFRSLMQPDRPGNSCCGEADAYEADVFEVEGDHYVAVVTGGKFTVPTGTRIVVPNSKVTWNSAPNPTGHGIVFLSSPVARLDETAAIQPGLAQGFVYVAIDGHWYVLYCYTPPSGV